MGSRENTGSTSDARGRNPAEQTRPDYRKRQDHALDKRQNNPPARQRDDGYHHGSSEFRKLMQAELTHIPALDKRMDRLMNIQAERYDLQGKRQKVALDQNGNREAIVQKFHGLLRRDLDLADQSKGIVQEIVKDMPTIQDQLTQRRTEIESEIKTVETSSTAGETSSSRTRELRRRLRYLDFLGNKLDDLKNHPDRLDLLSRVLRGLPFDDNTRPQDRNLNTTTASTTSALLSQLYGQRKNLQRDLRKVERRIDELRVDDESTSGTP